MQKWIRGWGLALLATSSIAVGAQYRVVQIESGDRIQVEDEKKVRSPLVLIGVAAPRETQDYFQRAKNRLGFFLLRRRVDVQWVTPEGRCLTEFRGRCVRAAKVLIRGDDIGLKQISDGSAWAHRPSAADQSTTDRALYLDAEARAQRGKRGLWNGFDPVAPWLWTAARAAKPRKLSSAAPAKSKRIPRKTKNKKTKSSKVSK